ncbi:MAG: hypothetical protein U5K37_09965 [Natrialbaceae archaeon]|nr:hypothetical protein [Natrialbaceae archaeon]
MTMDTSGSPNADNLASILEVAMTVREPRSAGQIAEATGLAEATVETYLTQLVEVDTLATLERGRKTCYYPDPVTQYFDRSGTSSPTTRTRSSRLSWTPSERKSRSGKRPTTSRVLTSSGPLWVTNYQQPNADSDARSPRTGSTSIAG